MARTIEGPTASVPQWVIDEAFEGSVQQREQNQEIIERQLAAARLPKIRKIRFKKGD